MRADCPPAGVERTMIRRQGEPPSDAVQSVSRALRILEVVGESAAPLPVKRIARQAGLRLSTTYHLVRTLAWEGYLTRHEDGGYGLGLEVADRFRDLVAALSAPPRVEAVLRDLAARTGRSHYLARFVDGRVAIADVAEGPRSPHVEDLVVGFDEGAHATALGKALLSTLTPLARHRYLAEAGMRPYTASTLREPDDLEADLAGAAEQGVFVEHGQYRDGVSCAGVVVRDGQGRAWALACSDRPAALAADRAVTGLRLAAAATALGRGLAEV